jgi:hypothetical protein
MREESNRLLWVVAGILPVSGFALFSGLLAPSPFAPSSLLAVLPAMLLAGAIGDRAIVYLVPAVGASFYLVASIPLIIGKAWAWGVSAGLFAVLGLANAAYLILAWSAGVQFQGTAYTTLVVVLNVLAGALVGAALARARHRPTLPALLLAHVALFCWLNWIGFPWLGEMP